ncbi:hypothetical protein BD410DRAFT_689038, partial [Rickenella mellea]
PTVDPRTLCPYCDQPLPEHPTEILQQLLHTVLEISRKDPRKTNPLGLKADVKQFVAVCQRHRFETKYLTMAKAAGWPTEIDFEALPTRISAMRESLQKIVDGVEPSPFLEDVEHDIRANGTRMALSLKGDFQTFDRIQPGYYGLRGRFIITNALYNLFLGKKEPLESGLLTPERYVDLVLLPETAVRLIALDMGIGRQAAMVVMKNSAKFGQHMFP